MSERSRGWAARSSQPVGRIRSGGRTAATMARCGCPPPTTSTSRSTSSVATARRCCCPMPPGSTATPTCRSPMRSTTASPRTPSTTAATATHHVPARTPMRPRPTSTASTGPDTAMTRSPPLASLLRTAGSPGSATRWEAPRCSWPRIAIPSCSTRSWCSSRSCSTPTPTDRPASPSHRRSWAPAGDVRRSIRSRRRIDNYRSKLPMSAFDPEVVRLYVAHGFRSAPEGIRLKCDPEHEARTFENGGRHRTWDLLPDISDQGRGRDRDRRGHRAIGGRTADRRPVAELDLRGDPHVGPLRPLRRPGADGDADRRSCRHRLKPGGPARQAGGSLCRSAERWSWSGCPTAAIRTT